MNVLRRLFGSKPPSAPARRPFAQRATSSAPEAESRLEPLLSPSLVFTPTQPKPGRRQLTGRQAELQRILQALAEDRAHVVLYSERGRGKTSLSNMIIEALRQAGMIVARHTCEADSDFDSIMRGLMRDLPNSLLASPAETGRGDGCEPALPEQSLRPGDVLALPGRLACSGLVCLVDEFDRVQDRRTRTHHATGGIVAAPTLGLPEKPGGSMNWDYRYCWLRDSTFTLTALLNAGFHSEAEAWLQWLLRAVAGAPDKMQIMYRVDGGRRVEETELTHLPGWNAAKPVRLGNAAAGQRQLDVYGEVLDSAALCHRAGIESTAQGLAVAAKLVAYVEGIWREPDQGMWESREAPQHYVYSKVMAWVAVDRFLRLGTPPGGCPPERRAELEQVRDAIHADVCTKGFDAGRNSFMQSYGSRHLDASVLLLPLVGLRFLQGLAAGFTIPLLLTVALQVLPPPVRLYGLAAYALTATFGPNISTALAGLWTSAVGWQFVFYEAGPLCTLAGLLVWHGVAPQPPRYERIRQFDWPGAVLAIIGFSALTTMLEHGDRLDWFNSKPVCVMALLCAVALPLLVLNDLRADLPLYRFSLLQRRNYLFALITLFTFLLLNLSAGTVPGEYLQRVGGFRPEQSFLITILIAGPQFLLLPLVALLLDYERVDSRWVMFAGIACVFTACIGNSFLTSVWDAANFLLWQSFQAVGAPLVVMPLLMMAVNTIKDPADGPFASTLVNTMRGLAEPVGVWMVQLIMRWRGALHYSRIVDQSGQGAFNALQSHSPASVRAFGLAVEAQATVLTISDAFLIIAALALVLAIVLAVLPVRTYPPRIIAQQR